MMIYNDREYEVTPESIYRDFSIDADSIKEACSIAEELDGMSSFTFNGEDYIGMVVTKMSIIIVGDSIRVNVILRNRSKREILEEEVTSLRTTMEEIASSTTNEVTNAKINAVLKKGVTLNG